MSTRVYLREGTLSVTAFPLPDSGGYAVRVGDNDYDGVYLGAVFHERGTWVAYSSGADEPSHPIGSGTDLDDVVTEMFLSQVRFTNDLE